LYRTETATQTRYRSKIQKAENRLRIAQCKLDRLKARFDRVSEELADVQHRWETSQKENLSLRDEVISQAELTDKARQEALMWRTQLFEKMEQLEDMREKLESTQDELKSAWQRLTKISENHQTSYEELCRRDKERRSFQAKIEELQRRQSVSQGQTNDLLEALTGAEAAIESLQRSNDKYQREVDGLKSLGQSLTEQLSRLTDQRDSYARQFVSAEEELEKARATNRQLKNEVERLTDELYETKGKLITYQLESDVREIRRTGKEKSEQSRDEKYKEVLPQESPEIRQMPNRSLLHRATKKVSGWFRLS